MTNKNQLATLGDAAAWNSSVRLVTMFYHWGLVRDYAHLVELLVKHQAWLKQPVFKDDGLLLEELVRQWPQVDGRPRIWACFHIGPYGLIPRALLLKNRGVAVLLKDEVFEEQRHRYVAQFLETFRRQPTDGELRFVRSGDRDCLVQLKRSLEDGLDIVCFVDGQEGSAERKGWTMVNLRNVPIPVRYGMAVLSRWTGAAVRPVVFSLIQGALRLCSLGDVHPVDADQYQSVLQHCYDLLHDLTAEEWVQWEFASSFFEVVMRDHAGKETTVKHEPWWLPVMTSQEQLLIDVKSGQTTAVPETAHQDFCERVQALIVKF